MSEEKRSLWVKICGVRDVETAIRIADLGADAIGLNFYPPSPRSVPEIEIAAAIVDFLPASTAAVGVFVNHSVEEIKQICRQTGIQRVQLHGDEPDSVLADLSMYQPIRALHQSDDFGADAADRLAGYARTGIAPSAWLIDARVQGAYGGTGQTVDWDALSPESRAGWPPLLLAGGLTPANVGEAIRIVKPHGVDVASGVESAPGVKDLLLVEQFIAACR